MFKSLLIIIIVALGLWAARNLVSRMQNRPSNHPEKMADENKNMLQCAQCHTYIPSEDAITKGDKSFCSTQHLEDWNKSA